MYLALRSAHQNTSAGSKYMHLRSMMAEQAVDTDDVGKLLGQMDNLRQKLRNICPDGNVTIDDVYISSVISALPDSWTAVTAPLELQKSVTVAQLNNVLCGHIIKLKNRDCHLQQPASVAANAAVSNSSNHLTMRNKPSNARSQSSSKSAPTAGSSSSSCGHCGFRGHSIERCRTKQLNDLRKEIEDLKTTSKRNPRHRAAKATAPASDSESGSSVEEVKRTSSKAAKIRFS